MSQNLERLKRLLAEVFQLDQAELDFGIYRIMNTKREEIIRFLDQDLLPQVREAFHAYESENRGGVEAELAEAIKKAKELGADPETLPRVKELRAKLAEAVDVTALENEVYSHLYSFFRRYYQEGDFISLRRYKEGVYAMPYEGEEVKLHWANHDQYYIKTSEYLRDYTFKLPSGKRVHFKLVEADTDKDNNRAPNGNERRFILSQAQPLAEENGELVVRFDYRPHPDRARQADLNAAAVDCILHQTTGFDDWRRELVSPRPTEKNANRTLLEKHLTDYTARNTFDYFIHKDLGGFLRRELDFYIKNEVMHLDDVESEAAPRVEQYVSKIKAIRRIAHKIIDFLAQIENFQKRLWLKKKFVVETQYCVTVDRIFAIEDEEARKWLIGQIIKNDAQRQEWVSLCAIDEIKGDLTVPSYSKPLKPEFLKAHPTLVVDTRHFQADFTMRLLAAIPDLDDSTDGVLIHSENFQACRIMEPRCAGEVTAIFADPPYNTGVDGFPYKDTYQHSSWLAMMENRLLVARPLLSGKGLAFFTIDFIEVSKLRLLCDYVFGPTNFLADIAWEKRYTRSNNAKRFYSLKDTVLAYRASEAVEVVREARSEKSKENYTNPDADPRGPWISSSYVNPATKEERPNLVYKIRNPHTGTDVEHPTHAWKYDPGTHRQHVEETRLYWGPGGSYEFPRLKSFLSEANQGMVPIDIWHHKDTGTTDDGGNAVKDLFGGAVFDNPKPPSLVKRAFNLATGLTDAPLFFDHFAGSGTTGHAVIDLNREDGGRRKFILVEMGDYFSTVLVPRIKKVIFTPEWKDGKPIRMPTQEEVERSPRIVKVLRLESYEDTINSLELKRLAPQQTLLEQQAGFREDYVLRYMLDVETRESPSLLNVEHFEEPFSYKLSIATGSVGETKPTVVDLVETFNYLVGLRVKTIDDVRGVRVVTGINPSGERVLILWRKTKELDNDALDAWFRKQGYNTKDQEFDVIYVNGDNNLENLRKPDQTWKVRLIEEEFRRLMFDVRDV